MKLLEKVLEKFGIFSKEFDKKFCETLDPSLKFEKDLKKELEDEKYIHQKQPQSYSDEVLKVLSDSKNEKLERKVGEKFDYKGTTLEVVEDTTTDTCENCFFKNIDCSQELSTLGACSSDGRFNKKSVSFIPVAEGNKFDTGKLSYTLLPFPAITEVVKVLMFGEQKYGRDNWQKVANAKQRYLDAYLRHCISYCEGETYDPESSKHHLAHAVCCLLFILWFDLTDKKEEV